MQKTFLSSPIVALLLMTIAAFSALGQQEHYSLEIDLSAGHTGTLEIKLTPPSLEGKKAALVFPRIIPGTYEEDHYGRFIKDLTVHYKDGSLKKVKPKKTNDFIVKNPALVDYIQYRAEHTWTAKGKEVFEPAGTLFRPDTVDLLNFHAMCPFYLGHQELPYSLKIRHAEGFYGAGSLPKSIISATEDSLWAESFDHLADSPMLYAAFGEKDTVTIDAGGCTVEIAVFAEGGNVNAQMIKEYVQPAVITASGFLGELVPEKYAFLFYMPEKALYSFGALEHKRSSVYYLPDNAKQLDYTLGNTVSHEFLHILTPLHLHSEYIEPYNFHEPQMSKHLWLYEGVTEYLSMKNNLAAGLIDTVQFFEELLNKDFEVSYYKELSLTEASEKVLTKKGQDHYSNYYAKGALVAFLLDVEINTQSGGDKGLLDLLKHLISKYGMSKPFPDDGLFDEIIAFEPALQDIIDRHIIGDEFITLRNTLSKLGVKMQPKKDRKPIDWGSMMELTVESLGQEVVIDKTTESSNTCRRKTLSF